MPRIDRALRSNIKLRHLQLVVTLDELRHLGRTAEFLSVTQPAVSKMLGEVESMLGFVLFERSTRGSVPTAAGRAFVRFARSALAGYERTRDEIAAEQSGLAGRTRVGSMAVTLPTLLAQAVDLLKQQASQATVLIEEGDLTHLLPKLRLGELDVFVGRLEPGYAAPDLVTEALYEEAMRVVVRPGHPLTRRKSPAWQDLAELPCVLPPPWASLRVKIEQQFFRHGLQLPRDLVETPSFLAQVTFVQQRGAAAFMADAVARSFEAAGLVQVLALEVPVDLPPVGLITLRERALTPVTRQLIDCLRTAAEAHGRAPGRRTPRARKSPASTPGAIR